MVMVQRGINNKYPEKIEAWRRKDSPAPSWITDNAIIESIQGKDPVPEYRKTNTGGYEIVGFGGVALVSVNKVDDYVCLDLRTRKIITLTPKQLQLLYTEDLPKRRKWKFCSRFPFISLSV